MQLRCFAGTIEPPHLQSMYRRCTPFIAEISIGGTGKKVNLEAPFIPDEYLNPGLDLGVGLCQRRVDRLRDQNA